MGENTPMTMLAPPSPQTEIFDLAHDALIGGDIHAAMGTLRRTLREQRSQLPREAWVTFGAQARRHPLHRLLLESPFTRRAYEKPRGYAGDAGLMDLIYGSKAAANLSPLGGMLYGYEFDSPCFQSVRTRRAVLAQEIDNVAAARPNVSVLAVASGHLREIEWSRAARAGAVSITALDQDRESLACINRDYAGRYRVSTIAASIGDLLRRSVRITDVDLVYAAGLYDYLDTDLARTLTAALFEMLVPGGRLFIANFTPATHDAAFMEAFMDWRLIYRTAAEVRALADGIDPADLATIDQFCDENHHVAYMRLVRR
jgi:extracellular factor (EF) 3-hydroxypalmitic acid methyl ester biosynthesis protein